MGNEGWVEGSSFLSSSILLARSFLESLPLSCKSQAAMTLRIAPADTKPKPLSAYQVCFSEKLILLKFVRNRNLCLVKLSSLRSSQCDCTFTSLSPLIDYKQPVGRGRALFIFFPLVSGT